MIENQDKKRELIIETALKRFAHFGLQKTTMTEIATDLSLSKALLYYYFPDKISLYAAAFNKIITQLEKEVKKGLANKYTSLDGMLFLLDKRHEYIKKYYNLLDITKAVGPNLPEVVAQVFLKAKQSDIFWLKEIIEKGHLLGELKITNGAATAELLFYALAGMRFSVLNEHKIMFLPKKEQFDEILTRQKELMIIFLKGIRNQHKS